MNFKPGDQVKFLNAKGGGTVTRIISPGIVGVAIEDGFEIPTAINEIVKTEPHSAAARFFSDKGGGEKERPVSHSLNPAAVPAGPPVLPDDRLMPLPPAFRQAANPQGVLLSYQPIDQKWLITGYLNFNILNFSEYDLLYCLFTKGKKGGYEGKDYGSIPPFHQITVDVVRREDLDYQADGIMQMMFMKDAMPQVYMPVTTVFKIKPVRFTREDNYKQYGFVNGRAFVYQLSEIRSLKSLARHEEALKYGEDDNEPVQAKQVQPESFITRHKIAPREAEVDLHIEAMVDDYKQLKPEEILSIQLAYFTKCLEAAFIDNYYKVTFIHGIGNGILKAAIKEKLREYESIYFQQAPVAKYGMGAVEVIIMQKASGQPL
jgi:hypothetical protein